MNNIRKPHCHPYKEFELATKRKMFEVIVDDEFKDLFRYHRDIPDYEGHIFVKLCEFMEQTVPPSDLGDIVRTGTQVRVTHCTQHPEYVGMSGVVAEWIIINSEIMYAIEVNGLPLEGWAHRNSFEVIEQTSSEDVTGSATLTDLDLDFCRCQILPNGINGALRPVKNTSKQFIYRIVYEYEHQGGRIPRCASVMMWITKFDQQQGKVKRKYYPTPGTSRKDIYAFVVHRKAELNDRYQQYIKGLYT